MKAYRKPGEQLFFQKVATQLPKCNTILHGKDTNLDRFQKKKIPLQCRQINLPLQLHFIDHCLMTVDLVQMKLLKGLLQGMGN